MKRNLLKIKYQVQVVQNLSTNFLPIMNDTQIDGWTVFRSTGLNFRNFSHQQAYQAVLETVLHNKDWENKTV